ncbi:MAG: hypothetical protein K9N38_05840 [Candidatus Marinimicrobia bacterium]|nr:hypothetical protein [Candidatus Neomarinimicrobiota bacterium]
MLKQRDNHYLTDRRLLISNLQKTIRRQQTERAVRTALCLLEHHPRHVIRRLPIIMVEDTILHPKLPLVIELMVNESEGKEINSRDADEFLSIVRDLCGTKEKDLPDDSLIAIRPEIKPQDHMGEFATTLTQALRTRKRFGGMKFDMGMLSRFADHWEVRFTHDELEWYEFLASHYPERDRIDYTTISPLQESDILVESVDHHCSPIANILNKKNEFRHEIQSRFQDQRPLDVIKDFLWCVRSSWNPRPVFWDSNYETNFLKRHGWPTDQKYLELNEHMGIEIDNISRWYITKKHKEHQIGK